MDNTNKEYLITVNKKTYLFTNDMIPDIQNLLETYCIKSWESLHDNGIQIINKHSIFRKEK